MLLLSKEAILQAEVRYEDIYCPESKGDVRCRGLTARERGRIVTSCREAGDLSNESYQAKVVACGTVGKDGENLFEFSDYKDLMNLPSAMIERLCLAIERLSGLGAAAEEIAKNSPGTPSESSDSGSASPSGSLIPEFSMAS